MPKNGQTVLPDRSVLIGQKLVENAKTQKLKCDSLSNFQTMWLCLVCHWCLKSRCRGMRQRSFANMITSVLHLCIYHYIEQDRYIRTNHNRNHFRYTTIKNEKWKWVILNPWILIRLEFRERSENVMGYLLTHDSLG